MWVALKRVGCWVVKLSVAGLLPYFFSSRPAWMLGRTPPWAIVTSDSSLFSSSSLRTASWRWRGMMRVFLLSQAALPASSRTSAARYSDSGPLFRRSTIRKGWYFERTLKVRQFYLVSASSLPGMDVDPSNTKVKVFPEAQRLSCLPYKMHHDECYEGQTAVVVYSDSMSNLQAISKQYYGTVPR